MIRPAVLRVIRVLWSLRAYLRVPFPGTFRSVHAIYVHTTLPSDVFPDLPCGFLCGQGLGGLFSRHPSVENGFLLPDPDLFGKALWLDLPDSVPTTVGPDRP